MELQFEFKGEVSKEEKQKLEKAIREKLAWEVNLNKYKEIKAIIKKWDNSYTVDLYFYKKSDFIDDWEFESYDLEI